MPYKDKDKNREYHAKWYKSKAVEQRAMVNARRKQIKEWFWEYKKTLACSKCGFNHPAVIDFHHTGKKEAGIAELVQQGSSKEKILAEIKRCEVLCSNCHRILHSGV